MLINEMKPGRSWAPLLAALLLSTLACFGSHAEAAVVCKTKAQRSSKACAGAVHKKAAVKPKLKRLGKSAVATPVGSVAPVTVASAPLATAQTNAVPTTICFAALAASQASQHIAAKVPFFVGQAPGPGVLANASHPSKKEHEELSSLIAGYQMCQEMSAPALQANETGPSPSLTDEQWRSSKSILEALQAGKLSYGAAARALADAGHRN